MSAWHASWFCKAVNPFIAMCVHWIASAGSRKILTGVCLFCESVAAASCQKNTLHCDSGRNTAAIQHRLKTYGAHSLDRYLICLSNPNFPDDYLYRFRFETVALGETRQSISQSAFFSSYRYPIEICIDLLCFEICFACQLCHCLEENGKLFQSLSAFLTSTLSGQNARTELIIKSWSEPSPEAWPQWRRKHEKKQYNHGLVKKQLCDFRARTVNIMTTTPVCLCAVEEQESSFT